MFLSMNVSSKGLVLIDQSALPDSARLQLIMSAMWMLRSKIAIVNIKLGVMERGRLTMVANEGDIMMSRTCIDESFLHVTVLHILT
jgi:hypothetical protein